MLHGPGSGLGGKKNGELLLLAEKSGFEIFLTPDKGVECEQNLEGRNIAVILVSTKSSRLADLLPRIPAILAELKSARAGRLVRVYG
jgi:hypothetical protein